MTLVESDRPIDFVLIGAMKCGTTSLHHDLGRHDKVQMPAAKEPNLLLGTSPDRSQIQKRAARLYTPRHAGQLRGEASTSYSKFPDVRGVAERARRFCGPGLLIIYMVRDPFERARSHFDHEVAAGSTNASLLDWLRATPAAVDYSRYQMQLDEWLQYFPRESVLVVNFERYRRHRASEYQRVIEFLGLDVAGMTDPVRDSDAVANRTQGKRTPRSAGVARLIGSELYTDRLKSVVPASMLTPVRRLLTRANRAPTSELGAPERSLLADGLSDDDIALWRDSLEPSTER